MKVLGISCGRRMSNTEIMVKEALMGAEEAGAEVEFLRLQDLLHQALHRLQLLRGRPHGEGRRGRVRPQERRLPLHRRARSWSATASSSARPSTRSPPPGSSRPSRTAWARRHDQGFRIIAQKIREEKGITTGTGPDPRSFKPRAASLIAVGGSEWDTLALPIMSMFALTLQMEVVDKILINWIGLPKVVSLRDDLLAKAHRSGKHVAETLKKPIEEAEYIGEPGLCPLCHSKLIEVRHDHDVYPCICAICGVRGTLSVTDGQASFTVSDEDRPHSHLLLSGKFEHLQELADVSLKPPANYDQAGVKSLKYRNYLTPLEATGPCRRPSR